MVLVESSLYIPTPYVARNAIGLADIEMGHALVYSLHGMHRVCLVVSLGAGRRSTAAGKASRGMIRQIPMTRRS